MGEILANVHESCWPIKGAFRSDIFDQFSYSHFLICSKLIIGKFVYEYIFNFYQSFDSTDHNCSSFDLEKIFSQTLSTNF